MALFKRGSATALEVRKTMDLAARRGTFDGLLVGKADGNDSLYLFTVENRSIPAAAPWREALEKVAISVDEIIAGMEQCHGSWPLHSGVRWALGNRGAYTKSPKPNGTTDEITFRYGIERPLSFEFSHEPPQVATVTARFHLYSGFWELTRDDGASVKIAAAQMEGERGTKSGRLVKMARLFLPSTYPINQSEPEEAKDMSIDHITLLQIEKGVRIWRCTIGSNGQAYSFKAEGRHEFKLGENVLVITKNGPTVANIVGEDDDFEPQAGLVYRWAVPIDMGPLLELDKLDRGARRKVQLGSAIVAAKEAMKGIDVELLPPPAKAETD